MLVFVDLDGVLADFVGGVCRKFGKPDPYTRPEAQGEWGIEKLLGIEPAAFWEPLGEEFWANLSPTHDWHSILSAAVAAAGDPANVALLTSPCETPGCLEGKKAWIANWLPEYRRSTIFCSRKDLIAGPGKVLIDDSDANVRAWEGAGGTAVLVPRHWNAWHEWGFHSAAVVRQKLEEVSRGLCPKAA